MIFPGKTDLFSNESVAPQNFMQAGILYTLYTFAGAHSDPHS